MKLEARMDNFFDSLKEKVDQGITTITTKSKEALELAKLRTQLKKLEEKKEEELKAMGNLAYHLLNINKLEQEKFREAHASLKEIDAKITSIKEEIKKVHEMTARTLSSSTQEAFTYCGCGSPLKESAKFCPRCGTNVQQIIEKAKEQKIDSSQKCPECGGDISKQSKFCPNCGKTLMQDSFVKGE